MKIYLDVSCLNRPWDDQSQARIRLESEAMAILFERIDEGLDRHVSSQMAQIEIETIPDEERRKRVFALLPDPKDRMVLTAEDFRRAKEILALGLAPADAIHIAAAEACKADVMLSCDDRLVRRAGRARKQLRVRVANPLDWLKETNDAQDA